MISVREMMEAAEGLPRMAGRSSLYRWMMANREELGRELLGARPDWSALALVFGRHGLLDRNRHMPTGQTARMTWWRVRQDAAKLHGAGVSESDALSIAPQPEHLVDRRTKRRVKAAAKKLRPNTAAKRAEPREPPPGVREVQPPASQGAEDQIANAMRQLDKGKSWISSPVRRPRDEPTELPSGVREVQPPPPAAAQKIDLDDIRRQLDKGREWLSPPSVRRP